jgi:peptide/nickel transport system substrate-binding protein
MSLHFLLAFLLIGCVENFDDDEIRFGIAQKPQQLDPRFQSDAASKKLSYLIYTPFIYLDDEFLPRSNVVEFEKKNDLQYVFQLKKNLPSFSEGNTLNINDMISTIQNLKNLSTSPYFQQLKNIRSVEKVSDNIFFIHLLKNEPNFLSQLNFFILPEKLLKKNHNFSISPLGSGLFRMTKSSPYIELIRRKDNQRINLIEIKDPTVRVLKLINGEIDLIQNDLPFEMIKVIQDNENLNTISSFGSNVSYIGFNFKDKYLKNIQFRRALSLAINQREILEFFLPQKSRLSQQILPPEHWASIDIRDNNFDPDEARKLISQIDIPKPIKLVLKTSTDPFRVKIATIIQKQLKDVGIDLKIKSLDWGTFFRDIQSGNFQLYTLTWVGITNPDIYFKIFSSTQLHPKGLNRGQYTNKKMDQLLSEAIEKNVWNKVILKAYRDKGLIPLWYEGGFAAFRKNISDYKLAFDGSWNGLDGIKKN